MLRFSSYYFPFKLFTWLMVLLSSVFLITTVLENSSIRLNVRPSLDSKLYDEPIDSFANSKLYLAGSLEISEPGIKERILIPQDFLIFDGLTNILLIGLSILFLRLLNKLEENKGFRTEISRILRIGGISLMVYGILFPLRNAYTSDVVKELTGGQYIYNSFSQIQHLAMIIGILLVWFSRIYKKGMELQQEKDLTI